MTSTRQPKLKPAKASVDKLKGNVRELCRRGRGCKLQRFIQEDLNAKLRGWVDYFRLSEITGVFEEIDGWVCEGKSAVSNGGYGNTRADERGNS